MSARKLPKRQRSIAKREKRRPARERRKRDMRKLYRKAIARRREGLPPRELVAIRGPLEDVCACGHQRSVHYLGGFPACSECLECREFKKTEEETHAK